MILLIDNYDSFTYNIYQYIGSFDKDITVVRNDKIDIPGVAKINPGGIILSPGPKRPEDAGICVDIVKQYGCDIPILGICLGHQAIGYAYGGEICGAPEIKHGKTSIVRHNSEGIFKGIKNPLRVMRYHSLIINSDHVPDALEVTAVTEDGVIMGVRHKQYPVFGVQFHPESILTECGMVMLKNFAEVFKRKQAAV